MLIDITAIKGNKGDTLTLDTGLDLSGIDGLFSDVGIKGAIKNIEGVLTFKAELKGVYSAVCDRCMEEVKLPLKAEINTIFDTEAAKDDSLTIENGKLDLEKTVYDALSLEIPIIILCGADCKGICPGCGVNLNKEPCRCADEEKKSSIIY